MAQLFYYVHLFAASAGDKCTPSGGSSFLGFEKWDAYLPGQQVSNDTGSGTAGALSCQPKLEHLQDIWLIVAALIEDMIRAAALVAIVMVVYGGVMFITSQGDPAKTEQARKTIINALAGVVISVVSAAAIAFIAGRF